MIRRLLINVYSCAINILDFENEKEILFEGALGVG